MKLTSASANQQTPILETPLNNFSAGQSKQQSKQENYNLMQPNAILETSFKVSLSLDEVLDSTSDTSQAEEPLNSGSNTPIGNHTPIGSRTPIIKTQSLNELQKSELKKIDFTKNGELTKGEFTKNGEFIKDEFTKIAIDGSMDSANLLKVVIDNGVTDKEGSVHILNNAKGAAKVNLQDNIKDNVKNDAKDDIDVIDAENLILLSDVLALKANIVHATKVIADNHPDGKEYLEIAINHLEIGLPDNNNYISIGIDKHYYNTTKTLFDLAIVAIRGRQVLELEFFQKSFHILQRYNIQDSTKNSIKDFTQDYAQYFTENSTKDPTKEIYETLEDIISNPKLYTIEEIEQVIHGLNIISITEQINSFNESRDNMFNSNIESLRGSNFKKISQEINKTYEPNGKNIFNTSNTNELNLTATRLSDAIIKELGACISNVDNISFGIKGLSRNILCVVSDKIDELFENKNSLLYLQIYSKNLNLIPEGIKNFKSLRTISINPDSSEQKGIFPNFLDDLPKLGFFYCGNKKREYSNCFLNESSKVNLSYYNLTSSINKMKFERNAIDNQLFEPTYKSKSIDSAKNNQSTNSIKAKSK